MSAQTAFMAIFVIIYSGAWDYCQASPPTRPHPFNVTIEPVTPLETDIPVTFNLSFVLDTIWYRHPHIGDTGSVTICFLPLRDRGDTLYYESWPVQYDETYSDSRDFQLTIPDNNIFVLHIDLVCGGLTDFSGGFFITIGDTIQFTDVLIDPPMPVGEKTKTPRKNNMHNRPIRDTLTESQLDAEYEVLLDLKDNTHRSIAVKILGQIPNSSKSDICPTCYILDVSLRNLIRLVDEGMEFEFTTPPPWSPEFKAPSDSVLEKESKSDSKDPQGASPPDKFHPSAPDGLSLDSIVPLTPSGGLPTDTAITFIYTLKIQVSADQL